MTGKFKKPIAFMIVFMLILSASIGSYAEAILGELEQDEAQVLVDESSTGQELPSEDLQEGEELVEEAKKVSLTINHIYNSDGEEFIDQVVIDNLEAGTTVNSVEYILEKDLFRFLESNIDSLVLSDTDENNINLTYEEIEIFEENSYDEVNYFKQPMSFGRMALMSTDPEPNEPGAVFIDKTAAWVDEANGIGKITMEINGNPIEKGADVVLVLDKSGSMDGSRLTKTKDAAIAFIDELYAQNGGVDSDHRIALVKFASNSARFPNVSGTDETFIAVNDTVVGSSSAKAYFNGEITSMTASGNTNYDAAFNDAQSIINGRQDSSRPTYIVFMSDGSPNPSSKDGRNIATTIKGGGTKIYALGLGLSNSSFTANIVPLATDPSYAKIINDNSDLTAIFTGIAGEIKIAGTSAIVTDFIDTTNFEIATKPGNPSVWYEATHGTATKDALGEVTWTVGDITQATRTLTIYIKVKPTAPAGNLPTNFSAHVDYTDYKDEASNKVFPMPTLPVGGKGQINMKYYLVDVNGKPVTQSGDPLTFAQRVPLDSEYFKDPDTNSDQLEINKDYTVEPPQTIVVAGVTYVYVPLSANEGGSPSTQQVTLTYINKSKAFEYGYKRLVEVVVTFDENYTGKPADDTRTTAANTALGSNMPANPIRTGYIFQGWNTASDGTGTAFDSSTTVTGNITVYGQWMINEEEVLDITSYSGIYDANSHGITVNNTIPGDVIEYSTDGGSNWTTTNPLFTNLIDHPVYVRVTNPNYEERTGDGRITITARPIEITAASASKTFDGNPLTNNGYTLTNGTLAGMELLSSVSVVGTQIQAGSSANVASGALIKNGSTDVTFNYNIKYVDGILTVNKPKPQPDPGPQPEPSNPGPRDSEPFITVNKEEIIDEEIPQALPELNKEDHFQYIQGYPDNTVRPEGLISREEVAAVFFRLLTEGYRNSIRTFDHNFPDVEINRWSAKHIATLAKGGIIKGYEDGSFRAGNFITRAELATIASRFDNLSPFEANSFSDITGHWANKYINSASAKGWVNGYPDGSFKPDQYITRAEFVTLVNNVLERRVHKEDILAESRKFPDLLETKWYYEAMQESINSHHIERMDDSYEEWIDIYYPNPEM